MIEQIDWETLSPHHELEGEPVSGTLAWDQMDVAIIKRTWLAQQDIKILQRDAIPPSSADVLKRACKIAQHYGGIMIRLVRK